MEASFAGLTAI